MTDNQIYQKLSDKIDKLCDKLDVKFDNIDGKLQNHETRLVVLEVHDKKDSVDWKTSILMLLAKSIMIGAIAIASLAGAGSIVSKMFGF